MSNPARKTGEAFPIRVVVAVVVTFVVCGTIALWMVNRCLNGEAWLPQIGKSPAAILAPQTPPKQMLTRPAETAGVVRSHIDIDKTENCGDCHELLNTTAAPPTVARLLSFNSCLVCHPAKTFAVTHGHVFEPLQDCELCHALHGSTIDGKGLLTAPREVLCNACHDGDH